MHRRAGVLVAVAVAVAAALPAGAASAEGVKPTAEQIENFAGPYSSVYGVGDGGELLVRWDKALRSALRPLSKAANLEAAGDRLAPGYGLSRAQMHELIELWILASGSDQKSEAWREEFHRRFTALAKATHQAPLVLAAAGVAWGGVGECKAEELAPLTEGASDRVAAAWTLVRARGYCDAWDVAFASSFPEKATPALVLLRRDTNALTAEGLTLYAYLTSDAALAHVAEPDRPYVSAVFNRVYVDALFNLGLTDEALTVVDRLPAEVRTSVLGGALPAREVRMDGLAVPMDEARQQDAAGLDLAAAYALAGRKAEAEASLAAWGDLAKARQEFGCIYAASSARKAGRACGSGPPSGLHAVILDHLLHGPGEDPYPIVEAYLSGGVGRTTVVGGGVWSDLGCKILSEPQYKEICEEIREATVDQDRPDPSDDNRAFAAALDAAHLPGYEALRARYRAALDAAAIRYGGKGWGDGESYKQRRANQHPAPTRFQQLSLPEAYRGEPPAADGRWIKTLAPLPDGYNLVRVERKGTRVAAISLSQNYDPTGEVSQGGYWVHLSEDGGKSWGRPLYTGLADRWPYVVLQQSKLPLIDGDVLNLAVEIQEIDPTTIIYPPVALQSRRQEKDLYLKIPFAELTRDSDGDGLTDIAKEHLLLKPRTPGARTPFIVGHTPTNACSAAEAAEQGAIGEFLNRRLGAHTGAIIMGIDRQAKTDSDMVMNALGSGRIDPNSADRPIFLEGDPDDFRCLRSDRLVIVYSPEDAVRLLNYSPDFHAVQINKVVYDRAHDRGFLIWSAGWTGGTVRLRRVDGRFVVEEIGGWIS